MNFSDVKSLKFSIPLNAFGAEKVVAEFDGTEKHFGQDFFWACGIDLGQAILDFAKTRKKVEIELIYGPAIAVWAISPLDNMNVKVEKYYLSQKPGLIEPADGRYEIQFTCRFATLVDAYRFMLKEFLGEYGADKFKIEFVEDFPIEQLKSLDKIAAEL